MENGVDASRCDVAALLMFSACGSLSFEACEDLPPDSKEACTCALDGSDKSPQCTVERDSDGSTSQLEGDTQVGADRQIGIISFFVTTADGFGFPRACQPFFVNFTYRNSGNLKAVAPVSGPTGHRIVIRRNPADGGLHPAPVIRDIPWPDLEPGGHFGMTEMFEGIKPVNPDDDDDPDNDDCRGRSSPKLETFL